MGADCVLLIAAALDDAELSDFAALAADIGLDVLVEVHDEEELERALATTSGDLIGVNQRDLVTFEVDRARAVRMAAAMPDGAVRVAESGVARSRRRHRAGRGRVPRRAGGRAPRDLAAIPAAALADLRVPRPLSSERVRVGGTRPRPLRTHR